MGSKPAPNTIKLVVVDCIHSALNLNRTPAAVLLSDTHGRWIMEILGKENIRKLLAIRLILIYQS